MYQLFIPVQDEIIDESLDEELTKASFTLQNISHKILRQIIS